GSACRTGCPGRWPRQARRGIEQLGHIGPRSGAATPPGNRRLLAQGEQVRPRALPLGRAGVTYREYPGAPGRTDEEADGAELSPRRVPNHQQQALDDHRLRHVEALVRLAPAELDRPQDAGRARGLDEDAAVNLVGPAARYEHEAARGD